MASIWSQFRVPCVVCLFDLFLLLQLFPYVQVFELVIACEWSSDDNAMVELELLTRTAKLALPQTNYSLVTTAHSSHVYL